MNKENTVYASVRETARRTGCSEYYLRQRIANNEIMYVPSGKKFLINVPKLLEQLENECRKRMGE